MTHTKPSWHVVLPDYQGVGIGSLFSETIAQMYKDKGYRIGRTTSNSALIHHCVRLKKWVMTRKPSRVACSSRGSLLRKSASQSRLTASFEYVGDNDQAKE